MKLLVIVVLVILLIPLTALGYFMRLHCRLLPYVSILSWSPKTVHAFTVPENDGVLKPIKERELTLDDAIAASPDTDADCFPDIVDNCRDSFNPRQKDSNSDGIGDDCSNQDVSYFMPGIKQEVMGRQYYKYNQKIITEDEVIVEKVESVTWPNTCLGRKAGGEYTDQSLNPCIKDEPTPGYRIILSSEGDKFEYRTNKQDYFTEVRPEDLP